MDPLIGSALIGAAANLGGGLINSGATAAANSQNVMMQNMMNQQTLNAQMAQHAQNTAFMEDQQAFSMEQLAETQKFNSAEAEKARLFSSNEAGRQMAFQYDLATSAYQRAMQDMKLAGLNPILAYQQGGGPMASGAMGGGPAASAGGSGSSMASAGTITPHQAPRIEPNLEMGRAVGNIATSAMETMRTIAGIDAIRQTVKESEARTAKTQEETKTEPVRRTQMAMETLKTSHEIENVKANLGYIAAQTDATLSAAGLNSEQIRIMRSYDSRDAPQSWERILRALGVGMAEREKKGPVMIDGKPLKLPPEAEWLQWLKRQFN